LRINGISGTAGNASTVWMSKADLYDDGVLTINDKLVQGDLVMRLLYER
jgi:hypothetical protein